MIQMDRPPRVSPAFISAEAVKWAASCPFYVKRDSIYTGWWHQHFAARCANAVSTEKIITTVGAFTPAASEMRERTP